MGEDITHKIREGTEGKLVTEKMRNPGSERQPIDTEKAESDPSVVMSQFKFRSSFIRRGQLTVALDDMSIYLQII